MSDNKASHQTEELTLGTIITGVAVIIGICGTIYGYMSINRTIEDELNRGKI